MANPRGNPSILQECLDQGDFRRRDDCGEAHRLPPWEDGQQQSGGQRPKHQRDRYSDDDQPKTQQPATQDTTEIKSGSLNEQDHRQRELGKCGVPLGTRARVKHIQSKRAQCHAQQHEDQGRRDIPAPDKA